ncbi:hypothetical protein Aduo_007663 [Ancylostoma duodenale]
MSIRLRQPMWVLCLLLVHCMHNVVSGSDSDTFIRLCQKPGLRGKGKLEGTTKCTITFPYKKTNDDSAAEKFCTIVTPFPVQSYTKGTPTICVYEKRYRCNAHEEDINDTCFIVHTKDGPFDPDACPDGYSLHVFTDRQQLKWVAVLLGEEYKATWVGNKGTDAAVLKPEEPPRRRKRDAKDNDRPIWVRLNKYPSDRTKMGHAYYGGTHFKLPYLCSREATPFEESEEEDNEFLQKLGYDIEIVTMKDGKKRGYIFLHVMLPVEATEFEANFTELHKACDAVDGYVATREDFDSEKSYKDILTKLGPWFMRTPVGRSPSFKANSPSDCSKDPNFEKSKKFWSYYDKKGTAMKMSTNVWYKNYPSNMCADQRRITAVMHKDGYVDVPAFVRRPVVCVAGLTFQ